MKTYVLKKTAGEIDLRVDYAEELNREQLDVVLHGDGPCLVLAGAGSGKTRTIVYRVSYLLERGIPPERILLLTFTNKAAREMMERVSQLCAGPTSPSGLRGANPQSRIWGGTFHSACHRILREVGERVGLRPGFTILDAEDARDLMKVCVRESGIDPGSRSGAGSQARRFPSPSVLLSVVSLAQNARLGVGDVLELKHPNFLEILAQIESVAGRYLMKKRESNAIDFDDLLILTHRLLSEDEAARRNYATQFRYVLVDEYQDTNPVQAEIVRLLASEHGNILVVGDDAQSIYSFRGADIRNILSFPKDFPGTKVFRLETNYRSTPDILDLANDVISKNANQFPKELKSVRPPFMKPTLAVAASAAQEAEFVAQRILELRDEGMPLSEMAVLFRATFHSQSLEFELMKRGIPYDYRGGLKFFDRAHVKDALAFLKLMSNKDDVVAWTRVLSLQAGIGGVTASKIYERVKSLPDPASIDASLADGLPFKAASGWSGFMGIWRELRVEATPAGMLRAVIDSDYARHLEAEYTDYKERLEDLDELASFAEQYEDVAAFLSDAVLNDQLNASKTGKLAAQDDLEERLVLSTIHQAKGLEWDAVFVIHLTEGQFPNPRAAAEEGGMEEERRLFYVAVTRARRELTLCHPISVGYDSFSMEGKSGFLRELDPRLVEELAIEESYDDLPTIEIDSDGEMLRPRRGLLKDISEY